MIKRTLTGLYLFSCLTSLCATTVSGEIDRLINKLNPHVNLGMVVIDLSTDEILYRRNAGRLFIPASNMKLFSEAAALMVLGPDYHFKNQLSISSGTIQKGILQGNVYIKLSGDPSFTRTNLDNLIQSLKNWNISTIQGNVYVDSSLANIDPYPPGWLTADLSYSYGAPIAPLMIDANRINVTANPGIRLGDPAIIEIDNESNAFSISNQTTTKNSVNGCGVGFALDQNNHLSTYGCLGVSQWAVQQQMAIKNPWLYGQSLIQNDLKKANIQLHGTIQLGTTPAGSILIATQQSKALSELMADTLKPSDNLYADSLYLHAASKLNGSSVNWKNAEPLIKTFLQAQTGIDFRSAIFTDGSGLSRYSLVSPEQTISLLKFLYQRFPLSYEYIAALPVSGRDGTLQKRFRVPTQQGFVRAKTGTMTGINSLSGYLFTTTGHTLAFAMFINRQPGKSAGPGRPIIDALCTYLLQLNPITNPIAKVFAAHQRVNFQLNPTQAQKQLIHQTQWRRLESAIRGALKNQAVSVIYRGNELVIKDAQADVSKVWTSLQNVIKKYPFAVVLASRTTPRNLNNKPNLLWVESDEGKNQRIWTIKEAL